MFVTFSYSCSVLFGISSSGDYGEAIDLEALKDFHRERFLILADSGADLIAFETIPNKLESQVLVAMFDRYMFLI